MADGYINTTISVEEFEKLKKQGKAVSPHVVKDVNGSRENSTLEERLRNSGTIL